MKLPNIKPTIRMDMVSLIFLETQSTNQRTSPLPVAADKTKPYEDTIKTGKKLLPITSIATPKLAPDVIPNTCGPASGFLNNVCINIPATDKPAPTKTAVIALGKRKFHKIISHDFLISLPVKVPIMASNGIETEPTDKFKRKQKIKAIPRQRNNILKRLLVFNGVNLEHKDKTVFYEYHIILMVQKNIKCHLVSTVDV